MGGWAIVTSGAIWIICVPNLGNQRDKNWRIEKRSYTRYDARKTEENFRIEQTLVSRLNTGKKLSNDISSKSVKCDKICSNY